MKMWEKASQAGEDLFGVGWECVIIWALQCHFLVKNEGSHAYYAVISAPSILHVN